MHYNPVKATSKEEVKVQGLSIIRYKPVKATSKEEVKVQGLSVMHHNPVSKQLAWV